MKANDLQFIQSLNDRRSHVMRFCIFVIILCMVGIFHTINKRNHFLTLLKSDSMVPELNRGDIILARKMLNYEIKDIVLLKVTLKLQCYKNMIF